MQSRPTLFHSLTPLSLGHAPGATAWILTDGQTLLEQGTGNGWQQAISRHRLGSSQVLDGSALYLSEGFTDIHCHGGGGVAFENAPELDAALEVHAASGTSGTIASLVANPMNELERTMNKLARSIDGDLSASGARLRGIHAEGPYLSPLHRGAHNPDFLIRPTPDQVEALYEASQGHLRQITLAPELDTGFATLRRCLELGIRVAVGHTDADYDTAKAAFDEGASLLTHTFNAMRPLHHRSPGPVAAAVDSPHVTLEVIADGVHVHAPLVRAAFAMASGRIALVTDAMAATGCADGHYMLGSLDVEVLDSVAKISGTDTIAGSTLTLGAAVQKAVAFGIPLADAVQAATVTPRIALGLCARESGLNLLDSAGQLVRAFR